MGYWLTIFLYAAVAIVARIIYVPDPKMMEIAWLVWLGRVLDVFMVATFLFAIVVGFVG